jgi:two-component system, OmpR family, alkaline phosphatase synthesis response regulator PhoP
MKRILVVEDELAIAEVVSELLGDEGYQVVTAANGQEALATLPKVEPDLVLSDVMMPLLDGRGLCRALAANPAYQSIPIVLMSAAGEAIAKNECTYNAYLHKPFELVDLLDTVERLIGGPD